MSDQNRNPGYGRQIASGLAWQYVTIFLKAGSQVLVLAVLSRLLSQQDFGLASIAAIFVNFASLISQMGVGPSIVQRHQLSARHIRVGFTLSILFGFTMLAILWLAAPSISVFFQEPILRPLVRVISLSFLLSSFGVVSTSLLQRDLSFGRIMVLDVVSYVLGYSCVSAGLAYLKFGVWALAGGQLAQAAISAALAYKLRPHSLVPLLMRQESKELVSFGFGFTLSRVFNYWANQGDYFVVGKVLGPSPLGVYTRAYQLMMIPAQYIGVVLEKVLFPAMSRIQDHTSRMRSLFLASTSTISLACAPIGVIMVVCAPELVDVILGSQWQHVVAPLQILSIGVLFRTSYKIGDSVAKSTGFVYQRSLREMLYAAIVVAAALVGAPFGLQGVALGVLGAVVANYFMAASLSRKILGFSWREYVLCQIPGLLFSLLVIAVCIPLRMLSLQLHMGPFLTLAVPALTSAIAVAAVVLCVPRSVGPHASAVLVQVLGFLPKPVRSRALTRRLIQAMQAE